MVAMLSNGRIKIGTKTRKSGTETRTHAAHAHLQRVAAKLLQAVQAVADGLRRQHGAGLAHFRGERTHQRSHLGVVATQTLYNSGGGGVDDDDDDDKDDDDNDDDDDDDDDKDDDDRRR